MPVLPLASILFWALALYYAIYQGSQYFSYRLSPVKIAFLSTCILFFTLYLAPNQYQILFWRSGMNTYLVPLLINTLILGRFFFYLQQKRFGILGFIELSILAFLAAGFSETVFALQAGFWGVILLFVLWLRHSIGLKAIPAILIGSFLGAALMILNPTNAARQSHFPPPPPIATVILTSVQYAKDFLFYSLQGTWLPFLILFFSGFLFGWLEFAADSFRWRTAFKILAAMVICSVFFLVCLMAPTIWSMSAYPEKRGLLTGIFILTLFIFSLGIWSGGAIAKIFSGYISPKVNITVGIILTLIIGLYLIRAIQPTYNLIRTYQKRAELWDARNAEIIQLRSEGQMQIVVPGIDSIGGILELQPRGGWQWVNNCAAQYYQINSIETTE